jgi:hypothetical protein
MCQKSNCEVGTISQIRSGLIPMPKPLIVAASNSGRTSWMTGNLGLQDIWLRFLIEFRPLSSSAPDNWV